MILQKEHDSALLGVAEEVRHFYDQFIPILGLSTAWKNIGSFGKTSKTPADYH